MIILPCILNGLQFWITDNFIKGFQKTKDGYQLVSDAEVGDDAVISIKN